MSDLANQQLQEELEIYTEQKKQPNLTFEQEMELADKIHNIKMKLNGVKPTDSRIDCFVVAHKLNYEITVCIYYQTCKGEKV